MTAIGNGKNKVLPPNKKGDISMTKKYPSWQQIQCLCLVLATLALISYPRETAAAVSQGLALSSQIIIPALFPFFILSSLVIDLGLSHALGRLCGRLMSPLFRLNGNCATALVLGFVGGYPVGAKTALRLYDSGQCTQTEAKRMLAFCNNAGPAFIVGVIGTGIFASGKMALLFYISHCLACVTVGILARFYKPNDRPAPTTHLPQNTKAFVPAFLSAVSGSVQSTLHICGFILCFSVLIAMLQVTGLLHFCGTLLSLLPGISPQIGETLTIGLLELSSGITAVPGHLPLSTQVSLMSFFLGWAGLSVHCQVLALAEESDLSMKSYFLGNFAQGILSALYSAGLLQLFSLDILPKLPENVVTTGGFTHLSFLSVSMAWISALFFIFSWLLPKKD